jgi:uncharacterized membrane protein
VPPFSLFDYIAFVWFLLCWLGYARLADFTRLRNHSVSARMDNYRRQWLRNMLQRDPRMVDTLIHSSLLQGVTFFASTSLLLIGGLLAILGASDKAIAVLSELPLQPVSRTVWEIKVLLLVVIFIYAFFKFAWCYRLFTYCAVLIGAAPLPAALTDASYDHADRLARLHSLAAQHFNNGLRSYFFALATLGWFLHPLLFIAAAAWVTWVVYRREFRSRSFNILSEADVDVLPPT